jgi:hypothetical protein
MTTEETRMKKRDAKATNWGGRGGRGGRASDDTTEKLCE